MKQFAVGAALLLVAGTASGQSADQPEETLAVERKDLVRAETTMVAAANPLAAEAGQAVLAAGGSAADAAVAIQLMLNLVEPQSSGIGGGAFALYWDASEARLTTFDARETAPLGADEGYWLGPDGEPVGFWDAVIGGRSVGVPGTLKLLEVLHQAHGRTPWAELFQPTIDLAEAGFPISNRLAGSIAGAADRELARFDETRAYFFDAEGAPKAAGTLLTNPAFARALRLIAAEGAAPFYTGAIAGDIVAAVRTEKNPGILTLEDLAAYQVIERPAICQPYRGHSVCGMGPPSSGGLTVGQILGLLEGFDLGDGPSVEAWHLMAEAARLAYADRGLYMADSDFVDGPVLELLDPEYLASRAALIDPEASMGRASAGTPPWKEGALWSPDTQPERAGTSHFVVVDAMGDMISITTTIETGFGSRVMTNGFLLNNELTDFSRAPERNGRKIANRVEGGKRPRSSMAPTIVLEEGEPKLLIGSPGGSRIIGYVAKSIVGILDWGMDPQTAIDMGHVINRNGATDLEQRTEAAELAPALEALGHEVNVRNLNSGLHAILITPDGLVGAADPRRVMARVADDGVASFWIETKEQRRDEHAFVEAVEHHRVHI
ncbi:MAG: gamma-glutamyltransferase, partial [Pseudomonadota bacterium]